MMFPEIAFIPMVILSTAATVTASQAVISGTYSITQQAVLLGYIPRLRVLHTSETEIGQIYLPSINWLLCAIIIILVIGFGSSSALASAYGVAVTGTMLTTTLLFFVVAYEAWHWWLPVVIALVGTFFIIDVTFLSANLLKIKDGGWLPYSLAVIIYTLMATWHRGRALVAKQILHKESLSEFLADTVARIPNRVPGTAVFLKAPQKSEEIPNALLKNLKHNKVLHENIIILTIEISKQPREAREYRYAGSVLGTGIYQVTAHFGFMELPDVPRILEECRELGLIQFDRQDTSFFVSRIRPIPTSRRGMALWREKLFAMLRRNAAPAPDFFRIPAEQVIEIDMRLEI